MRARIREDLVEFIVNNYLFGEVARIPRDGDSLIETGVVDSTGILELIEYLESQFGIEVRDSETTPQNLGSVDNLVKFVESKQRTLAPSQ